MKKHLIGALVFLAIVFLYVCLKGREVDHSIPPQELITIPRLTSDVQGIEITSAKVNLTERVLELEIRNYTARSVIGLIVTSGGRRGVTGMGTSGGRILSPFGTFTTTFPITNLHAGMPLSVGVVIW